jgi:hypothetical protein
VHALALERIKLELVLLGVVRSMKLLANVVLGEEDFVNATLFLSFHEDLNVLGFDLFQHGFIITVLIVDNLQLLFQQSHVIDFWLLFFDRRVVIAL